MEKLLTIVVPAFNMEKYLRRCIDSICIESVMNRVQVIVVNDGSKDRTSEIAHEYEQKYPHYIQVIDKENGNYGSCMNVGLSLAKGKYFRTLDADDWYNTDAYEKFVKELEKTDADMILCERHEYHEMTGEMKDYLFDQSLQLSQDIQVKKQLLEVANIREKALVTSICYKTEIMRDCHLAWSEGVFYTDTEYDYFPLKMIKTIRLVPLPVYIYLIGRNEQSVSSESIKKNFNSFYIVTKRILNDFITSSNTEDDVYEWQQMHLIRILRFVYQSLLFHGKKYEKQIEELDKLVCQMPELYKKTNTIDSYRSYYYVDAYRHNKVKFWLIRLDYMIRTNKIMRKLFSRH